MPRFATRFTTGALGDVIRILFSFTLLLVSFDTLIPPKRIRSPALLVL